MSLGLLINKLGYDQSWALRGDCVHYIDIADLWFPETNGRGRIQQDTDDAIAICSTCPVINECGAYALNHLYLHGIWGGLTYEQRKRLATRHIPSRMADHEP